MKPFLLDLYNKGFTGINLKEIFNLRSSYALRILELLLQYKGMANNEGNYERTFSFEKLRKILNVRGTYKNPSLFLKYVIISPISQINKKTRYTITYTVQRKGKKAIGVTFQVVLPKDIPVKETIDVTEADIIESKPKKENIPAPDTSAAPDMQSSEIAPAKLSSERQEPIKPRKKLEEYTEEEIYALEKLLKIKIIEKTAFEIIDKYGVKAVEWAFNDYNNAKSRGVAVNNPAGFIIDKIPQYESTVPTADDIFKLAEGFRAKKEEKRIKEKEEAKRQKEETNAKEAERKANRVAWKDWEVQALALSYIKNGNTFVDADKKAIEERGWKPEELLNKPEYMAFFHPNSEVSQYIRIRRKKNKAGDAN